MGFVRADLPDRIRHGFLEATGLWAVDLGVLRCYQFAEFHTGFTLFSPDQQTSIFVQMYGLPDGEQTLDKDLAFQVGGGKGWGKPPKGDVLQLNIFPADWTHAAFSKSPRSIVHQYRGPHRAVFIRYIGKSLRDPFFTAFNAHLRYLPDDWHLDLVNRELRPQAEPYVPPPAAPQATIPAMDLRAEQQAVRQMIVKAVERFAAEQQLSGGDLYELSVTAMLVYFEVGNGYASVNFDVRMPAGNDGSPSHPEYEPLKRENWRQLVDYFDEGHGVTLTGLDGKATSIAAGSNFDFDAAFGAMVVEVVKGLQQEKGFGKLLIGPGAEIFVEAHDATFVWPTKVGRQRGENRV